MQHSGSISSSVESGPVCRLAGGRQRRALVPTRRLILCDGCILLRRDSSADCCTTQTMVCGETTSTVWPQPQALLYISERERERENSENLVQPTVSVRPSVRLSASLSVSSPSLWTRKTPRWKRVFIISGKKTRISSFNVLNKLQIKKLNYC